ncbi:MAG: hypothetical protein AAF735_06480 [Myxococcota bacterium]
MIWDRAENDSSLARAQRRFALGGAVTITTTGNEIAYGETVTAIAQSRMNRSVWRS